MTTKKTHYRLTEEERKGLEKLAEKLTIQSGLKITKSQLVRLAIRKLLKDHPE